MHDVDGIHARQFDVVNPNQLQIPVTIIGVGSIGSPTARVLTQLGMRQFRFFDPDRVELPNVGTQFYRVDDAAKGSERPGKPKVEACRDNLQYFIPEVEVIVEHCAYQDQKLEGIVISGVDSMEVRKQIWKHVKDNMEVPLYLEGRTAGEQIELFSVRPCYPDDIDWYTKGLYSDKEAESLPCTFQGAPHAMAVLAGLIGNQLVRWTKGEALRPYILVGLSALYMEVKKPFLS